MGEIARGMELSRRKFVKGVAGLTAAGMLSGCAQGAGALEATQADSQVEEQIFAGVCRGNCAGGCFLNVHVRNGQVVRTTARDLPDARYNRICSKGLMHAARMYSSQRVLYPMKRIGERGEGLFERITWDEALDEIASKWGAYIEEYGAGSIGTQTGSGNYAVCSGNGMVSGLSRFVNGMGFTSIGNQFDLAAYYELNVIFGMSDFSYQNEPADLLNADTIICWGANPTVSQPQVMHFILEAKAKGAKYIVIDPEFNANGGKADKFVAVNPSTDGVLAFGIINKIVENGWVVEDFVRDHSTAPFLINQETKMLVRMSDLGVAPAEGEDDPCVVFDEATGEFVAYTEATRPAITGVTECAGIPVKTAYDNLLEIAAAYTPERVTELTGVTAEDVEYLASEYHNTENVNTYMMLGANHYVNAHYNYWPMLLISVLTGHIGRPGNACGWGEFEPLYVNFAATAHLDVDGNPFPGSACTYNINAINEVIETGTYGGWEVAEPYDDMQPASANVDVTKGGNPVAPLKSIYVASSNPAACHADHAYVERWLKGIEFLVVTEMSMTETAKYADILLPAAHWFEQEDMFNSFGTQPFFLFNDKAVEPLGESKSDFEIMKMICDRLGHHEVFGDMAPADLIRRQLDSEYYASIGLTYEEIAEKKAIRALPEGEFITYPDGVFNTKYGRALMYNDAPVPMYNVGQRIDIEKEYAPYWEPALEADVNSKAREKYPFFLLSERMRTRTHSQWWDVDYLKEYEAEPIVKINPVDAEAKGIAEGDTVRLFNDRGEVTLVAHINAGLPQGMIACPRAWQAEEFIDGTLASLPLNGYGQMVTNVCFNETAVDIEKL